MIPKFLLPSDVQLNADYMFCEQGSLLIKADACQSESSCPVCNKQSNKVHSRYFRTLMDLPTAGNVSRVSLKARKYFCQNPDCSRKIFTERFGYQIKPYHRRLERSNELLARMALELGGNTGSIISRHIRIPVSSSTILRIIQQIEISPKAVTSGIVGVDDWAIKKRKTYGSIIVDLKTKEVIDLLPDREASTLAAWLAQHPEIEIVSRDRYGPYALGVKKGSPNAIQVADRFHLLMNLGEAVKRVLQSKSRQLKEAFRLYSRPEDEEKEQEQTLAVSDACQERIRSISIDRQYKFEQVKELHQKGYGLKAISRTLRVHRQTIKKYLSQDRYPVREDALLSNFHDFSEYLLGEEKRAMNYKELYLEIKTIGFNGGYSQFCNNMNRLLKLPLNNNNGGTTLSHRAGKPIKTWSSTRLSMLLYMREQELNNDDDKAFLKFLYQNYPEIEEMEKMIKSFRDLFVVKKEGALQIWMEDARKQGSLLCQFAESLCKDFQAVNNAVITPYSNGQVEGHVNRLKNIKRRMYGRANFDLLRKIVLAKFTADHQN